MKKYSSVFFLFAILFSTCTHRKVENNNLIENTAIKTDYDDSTTMDNTLKNQPIIIGGYRIRNTIPTDTEYFITIGENYSSDFSGIERLQNTKRLNISLLLDSKNIDFSPLKTLPNLECVDIGGWGLAEVPDLGDIPTLVQLELDSGNLTSLKGIEKIPSLKWLEIINNRVPLTDISAIRYLRKLKFLIFSNKFYRDFDFSVFEDLPDFKELWLGGGAEIDLTGIGRLKSIESLRLGSNIPDRRSVYRNIEEISKLTSLKELYLDESIISVEFLAGNVNIENLTLIADRERDDYWIVKLPLDVKPLSNLTKLKHLVIRGFELENAGILETLPELESLDTCIYERE